jgi:hypothetical protein
MCGFGGGQEYLLMRFWGGFLEFEREFSCTIYVFSIAGISSCLLGCLNLCGRTKISNLKY